VWLNNLFSIRNKELSLFLLIFLFHKIILWICLNRHFWITKYFVKKPVIGMYQNTSKRYSSSSACYYFLSFKLVILTYAFIQIHKNMSYNIHETLSNFIKKLKITVSGLIFIHYHELLKISILSKYCDNNSANTDIGFIVSCRIIKICELPFLKDVQRMKFFIQCSQNVVMVCRLKISPILC